jgi:hypothetical protein
MGPLWGAPPNSTRLLPTCVTECSPRAEGVPSLGSGRTGTFFTSGGDAEVSRVMM